MSEVLELVPSSGRRTVILARLRFTARIRDPKTMPRIIASIGKPGIAGRLKVGVYEAA